MYAYKISHVFSIICVAINAKLVLNKIIRECIYGIYSDDLSYNHHIDDLGYLHLDTRAS